MAVPPTSRTSPFFAEMASPASLVNSDFASAGSVSVRGMDNRLIRFNQTPHFNRSPQSTSTSPIRVPLVGDQYRPALSPSRLHESRIRMVRYTDRYSSGGLVPARRYEVEEWDFERALCNCVQAPLYALADTGYSIAIKPVVGAVRVVVVLLGDVVGIFDLYLVMPIARGLGCCGNRRRMPEEEEGLIHAASHRILVKPIVGTTTVLTDLVWDVARVAGEYVLVPSALLVSGVSIGVGGGLMAFGQTLQRAATLPPSQMRYF